MASGAYQRILAYCIPCTFMSKNEICTRTTFWQSNSMFNVHAKFVIFIKCEICIYFFFQMFSHFRWQKNRTQKQREEINGIIWLKIIIIWSAFSRYAKKKNNMLWWKESHIQRSVKQFDAFFFSALRTSHKHIEHIVDVRQSVHYYYCRSHNSKSWNLTFICHFCNFHFARKSKTDNWMQINFTSKNQFSTL